MIDNFLWDVCNRHHSFALAVHDLLLETSMNVGAPVDYGEVNEMSFRQQYELETEFEMLMSAYEYDDQLIAMDKKSSKNFVDKQVRYHNLKPRFLEMKNMQQEFQVSSEQKFGHTRKSIEEKIENASEKTKPYYEKLRRMIDTEGWLLPDDTTEMQLLLKNLKDMKFSQEKQMEIAKIKELVVNYNQKIIGLFKKLGVMRNQKIQNKKLNTSKLDDEILKTLEQIYTLREKRYDERKAFWDYTTTKARIAVLNTRIPPTNNLKQDTEKIHQHEAKTQETGNLDDEKLIVEKWSQSMQNFPIEIMGPNGFRHVRFLLGTQPKHLLHYKNQAIENCKLPELMTLWQELSNAEAILPLMSGGLNMKSFMASIAVINVMISMIHEVILFQIDVMVHGTKSNILLSELFHSDDTFWFYVNNTNFLQYIHKNMLLILQHMVNSKENQKKIFMTVNGFPWPHTLEARAEDIVQKLNAFTEIALTTQDLHAACEFFALQLFGHLFKDSTADNREADKFANKTARAKLNVVRTLANASDLQGKFWWYVQKNIVSMDKDEMRLNVLRKRSKLFNFNVVYVPDAEQGNKMIGNKMITLLKKLRPGDNIFTEILIAIEESRIVSDKNAATLNLHDWILPKDWKKQIPSDTLLHVSTQLAQSTSVYSNFYHILFYFDVVHLFPGEYLRVKDQKNGTVTWSGCEQKDYSWYAKHAPMYKLQATDHAKPHYDHMYCKMHDIYTMSRYQERHLNDTKKYLLRTGIGFLQLCKYRHLHSILAQTEKFDKNTVDHILLEPVMHMLAHAQVVKLAMKCELHINKVTSIQKSMDNTLFSMKSNYDKYMTLEHQKQRSSFKQLDAERQISQQKLNTCKAFAHLFQINQINDSDVDDGSVNESTKRVMDTFALLIEYTKNNTMEYHD